VDELGFLGTKHFNFLRRGILEIGYQRLVVELDGFGYDKSSIKLPGLMNKS
jgi:hypothetical protein